MNTAAENISSEITSQGK